VSRRLALAVAAAALWTAGIGVRLYGLQVVEHDRYRAEAAKRHLLHVELEPPRGTIYDARGRELAVSIEVDSAWADPGEVDDPAAAARLLAAASGEDAALLERRLADHSKSFVWIARQLDPAVAKRVRELGIEGVDFLREYKRYYPMGQLAAQVIGYAGIDQRGLAGLEHLYDDAIVGETGRKVLLRDARQVTAASPRFAGDAARPGAGLRLTLDAAIQHVAERELARAVEASRATAGSVVILDPSTGAVLALASYPTLDLNRFPDADEAHWRNRPVMDAYEPGSTYKMVTIAAALADNLLDPSDVLDCEMGGITLAGVRIRDHHPFGLLTLREVMARSSNVGAIKTGLAVGEQRLHAMSRAFGFGAPTGVDLPAESPGDLRPVERWWPLTKAYVSFGQGLAVTPLQLAAAFGAVADGGTLRRPHVVAEVVAGGSAAGLGGAGLRTPAAKSGPAVAGRPVSEATARELERMLEMVVRSGTGKRAAIPGYPVAGKTGTAQKAVRGAGYSPTRFVASFVGFAPARRPALVAAVVVDEPWPRYHGGDVAAPVFAKIVEPALLYLGVPPEAEPADDLVPEPTGPRTPAVVLTSLSPDGPDVPIAPVVPSTPDGEPVAPAPQSTASNALPEADS